MGRIIFNKRLKFTHSKLRTLYFEVKKETKDFKEFNPELLLKMPQSLKIFRILIGISTAEFAKYFGKAVSTIAHIENGRFSLKEESAVKYVNVIMNLDNKFRFSKIKYKALLENYNMYYTNRFFSTIAKKVPFEACSRGGKLGGKKTLEKYGKEHFVKMAKKGAKLGGIAVSKKYPHKHFKKIGKMMGKVYGKEKLSEWGLKGGLITASRQVMTDQEIKIKNILDSYDISNFVHKKIKGSDRDYIVDFLVEYNDNKIIIEATSIKGSKSNIIAYSKALDLIERFKAIKSRDKKIKFLCVVSDKFSFEGFMALSNKCDCILLDQNIIDIINIISNIRDQRYLRFIKWREMNHILKNKIMFKNSAIVVKDLNIHQSEKKISDFLTEKKVKFSSQSVLENKLGSICIADFVLPSKVNPRLILEVTSFNGKSESTLSRIINKLETRFMLLKWFYVPRSKFIGIIDNVKQEDIDKLSSKFNIVSMEKFLLDAKILSE